MIADSAAACARAAFAGVMVVTSTLGSGGAWAMQCTLEPFVVAAPAASPEAQCTETRRRRCDDDGPRIESVTPSLAAVPGAWMHLSGDVPADRLAVRVDGRRVEPLYIDEPTLGGLYPVEAVAGCDVHVSVYRTGSISDSDCTVVEAVAPWFKDVKRDLGVTVIHDGEDFDAEEFPVSTGIALGDVDGDGDLDLYVANFALPGRLFRNDAGADGALPRLVDISVTSGVDGVFRGASANFADVDGDGDLDLYVGRDGVDVLFENRTEPGGPVRFVDVTAARGLDAPGPGGDARRRTAGVVFGDYDGDGRLDLYLSTHESRLNETAGMPADRLFWNAGERFEEVTHLLADVEGDRASFAAMWLDVDSDGDLDLLASADHDIYAVGVYSRPGIAWLNEGPASPGADGREWRFVNAGQRTGFSVYPDAKGQGLNAMGMDAADLDGDGRAEIVLSNIGPNVLLADTAAAGAEPRYADRAEAAGIRRTWLPWQPRTPGSARRGAWQDMAVTWGVQIVDGDNDGDRDVFIAGGSPPAGPLSNPMFGRRPIPNAWFVNDGTGQFADQAMTAGLADVEASLGTAAGDLDGDGWVDLVVANYRGPLRVYRNLGAARWPAHRALVVVLEDETSANRQALGARVGLAMTDGRQQVCEHVQRPGLSGGTGPACHFGLGAAAPGELAVTWPDGERVIRELGSDAGTLRCVRTARGGASVQPAKQAAQ